jgi:hypothetical protein
MLLRELHKDWKSLAADLVIIVCITGTVGIALKFVSYFNNWVWFPTFPNIFDSAYLIFSICIVFFLSRSRNRKR